MDRLTQFRSHVLLLIFCCILGFFAFNLYDKQVYETEGKTADNATYYTTWTYVKAARGDILDRI